MKKFVTLIALSIVLISCQQKQNYASLVSEAFVNLADITQYKNEISLKGEGRSAAEQETEFSYELAGQYDLTDLSNIRSDVTVTMATVIDDKRAQSTYDIKTENKIFYLRLRDAKLESLDIASLPPEFLSQVSNQWFFTTQPEQPESNLALQLAVKEYLREIDFFASAELLSKGEVRGEPASEFSVIFDRRKFQTFLERIAEVAQKPFSAEQKTQLQKNLTSVDFDGSIWVGDSDKTLRRISGMLRIVDEDEGRLYMALDIEFWGFGESIVIEIPANATPLPAQ